MNRLNFTKLQALGNDFMVICPGSGFPAAEGPDLARRACERHTGVGADGIILLGEAEGRPDHWTYRIFNADGSEPELCGNGLRAALACLRYRGLTSAARAVFLTAAGERTAELVSERGGRFEVRISIAEPRFSPADIPFDDGSSRERVIDHPLALAGGELRVTCLSVGNPHCGVFVERLPSVEDISRTGLELETHRFFPERTNVEFIHVRDRKEIEVAFWERGVGRTLSSGTGACGAAAAAMVRDLVDDRVRVLTALGEMTVEWRRGSGLEQTGPVEIVYEGTYGLFPD